MIVNAKFKASAIPSQSGIATYTYTYFPSFTEAFHKVMLVHRLYKTRKTLIARRSTCRNIAGWFAGPSQLTWRGIWSIVSTERVNLLLCICNKMQ